jgi:hypothetical protein
MGNLLDSALRLTPQNDDLIVSHGNGCANQFRACSIDLAPRNLPVRAGRCQPGFFALFPFAAAADLAGLRLLFCWSWWVRSFVFWCQIVGLGAPGFAGAGVDPLDDELVGFAELGILAATGFE